MQLHRVKIHLSRNCHHQHFVTECCSWQAPKCLIQQVYNGVCKVNKFSPHVRFWIPLRLFQITGTGFRICCQWKMNSELQSVVGFWIPWAGFQIPKPRIPNTTMKKFPGFRIRQATIRFLLESGFSWVESLERFRITITLKTSQSSWQSLKLLTKDLETPGS